MAALREMPLRSVLLTSGTLSPLESFAHELQLGFKYTLENPHVINPSQVGAVACTMELVLVSACDRERNWQGNGCSSSNEGPMSKAVWFSWVDCGRALSIKQQKLQLVTATIQTSAR
jgi:hypothetical protein